MCPLSDAPFIVIHLNIYLALGQEHACIISRDPHSSPLRRCYHHHPVSQWKRLRLREVKHHPDSHPCCQTLLHCPCVQAPIGTPGHGAPSPPGRAPLPTLVLPALTPRTLCAVPRHPLPVFLEAPPSCLLPAILPPSFRFPEPSLSAPDPANLTSPELHAACSTNPECRFSGPVLGFSRNPTLVLVILFNQFLQKRQDLLFLPPLYLPHIVVTPVSSSLLPVSSDSIARTPSFCSVKPPSVLLNPSRSDGTAEVPKADACCPAALKTEESGQVASRFSVPAHGDRIFSVEVSPQPLPLSSESALQLYPGTQNIWPLGAPRSLTLAQYRQKQASQEAAHSPGPPEAKALNQETHITNNNGEFSGALLVSGLWMAIKKAQ